MFQISTKKNKTGHEWAGKVIHWELCKRVKFDSTITWYMKKSESDLEKETHRIFWDFKIQIDHLISSRKPGLILVHEKKRTRHLVDFVVPADY